MKYTALAALGVVNACHGIHKPLFGLLEQGPNCPENDAKKLNHGEANRNFLKATYSGLSKGYYQSNTDIIDDKCFGEWADPTFDSAWALKKRIEADFWSVNLQEVKDVGSDVIDAIYKNADLCEFERMGDDMKHFCLENPGQCFFFEGFEDRLFDNLLEIIGELFDLNKLFMKDDTCYSDMEKMGEIYRASVDIGELLASLSGFDYKWDKTIERTHIKQKAFHTQIKEELRKFKGKDPLALMFPDLAAMINDFLKMFAPVPSVHHNQLNGTTHQKTHHTKKFDPLGDLFQNIIQPQQHHQQAWQPFLKSEFQQPQWNNFKLF